MFRLPRIRLPRKSIKMIFEDTCLLAGFIMLARGLWLISPAIMWIVCGLLLMWCGRPVTGGGK
jgi:hypothetical protein